MAGRQLGTVLCPRHVAGHHQLDAHHDDAIVIRAAAKRSAHLWHRPRSDLQKIDIPLMIIHGTADASIPIAFGRKTQKYLRDWRMIEHDGAPYGLLVTHAERLTKDIASLRRGEFQHHHCGEAVLPKAGLND